MRDLREKYYLGLKLIKKKSRLQELKDQRVRLCQDFSRYLDLYSKSECDSESLSIAMALLNSFDRSILRDNNLTRLEKDEIIKANEISQGKI